MNRPDGRPGGAVPGPVRIWPEPTDREALTRLLSQLAARRARGSRYLSRAELAGGAFGRLLSVRDEDLRRELAMRVMPVEAGEDLERLAGFLREARITAQLDHPGIVPVHELGLDEQGRLFFTMKLVVGVDLDRILERVRDGQPGWNQARVVRILLRVAETVAFAHDRGVVHGNLVPQNVSIGTYGETHVMDWSRARVVEGVSGRAAGTSPEIQADLGALGRLLSKLLAVTGSPAELLAIRDQALAPRGGGRYASMRELAADLRAYLENRVVAAYESGPLAELKKWAARNRAVTAIASLAMIVILLLTVWFAVNLRRRAAEATASAEAARRATARAEANTEQLGRLSDGLVLAELNAELDRLWPAHPEQIGPLSAWLDRAQRLVGRLPLHERTLAELRRQGRRVEDPGGAERFEFADGKLGWWQETLTSLVMGLKELSAERAVGCTIGAARARLLFASTVHRRSIVDAAGEWRAAIDEIKDRERMPAYRGLELRPQLGLVPIGRDPDSGLFEFWHLQTGERPERDARGQLVPAGHTGLVLVLIPGGSTLIGAQAEDPEGPHHDPRAERNEADAKGRPVHMELEPFFLSKYELTQGQWQRFTGRNPSQFQAGTKVGEQAITAGHPVERVSWEECVETLRRLDLALPSEAQWEYAARAGSGTPWWIGSESAALQRAGNLADRSVLRGGAPAFWQVDERLQDGFVVHARVGSFLPNRFGLHDTIGNVREWCRDGWALYGTGPEPPELKDRSFAGNRIIRGGGYWDLPVLARSSARSGLDPSARSESLGVRPARALD